MRRPTSAFQLLLTACFPVAVAASLCVGPMRGAQTANSAPSAFEVASIKPAGLIEPGRARLLEMMGSFNPRGLFSVSGQRVEARGRTAAQLVAAAYLIPVREIVGPPWISDGRFDVEALIPSGQNPDKASEMLRTLLQERLALKAHRAVRKMSGYILSVEKRWTEALRKPARRSRRTIPRTTSARSSRDDNRHANGPRRHGPTHQYP